MITFEESAIYRFRPRFSVVGCFIRKDNRFLLLKRQPHKPQGNTWGIPGGKIENGSTPSDTMREELRQETGLRATTFWYFGRTFVRYEKDEYDFVYHVFMSDLEGNPNDVRLNPEEHSEFCWRTARGAKMLSLIQHLDVCIKEFFQPA